MGLTKNAILQANATIIAGILILLTIQSITTIPTLSDSAFELKSLQKAIEYLQDMKANLTSLGDISQTRYGQQLDDELFRRYIDAAEPIGRAEAIIETQSNFDLQSNSSMLAGILIIPFSLSAAVEILDSRTHPNKSEPNRISLSLMFLGFFVMGFYLFMINILPSFFEQVLPDYYNFSSNLGT